MKDFILFLAGIVIGFLFGLIIYWAPLKQLKNELSSLKSLVFKKYRRGDEIRVIPGVDLKPVDPSLGSSLFVNSQAEMIIAYDVGVDWYFMSTGGHNRSRVVHASLKSQPNAPFLYKVPHHWIV